MEPGECCSGVTSLNCQSRMIDINSVSVNGLLFGCDSRILSPPEPRTSNFRGIRIQLPILKAQTACGSWSADLGNNYRTLRSWIDTGPRNDKSTRVSGNRPPPLYRWARA